MKGLKLQNYNHLKKLKSFYEKVLIQKSSGQKSSTLKKIMDELIVSINSFGSPVFYIIVILVLGIFSLSFAFKSVFSLISVEILCAAIKIFYNKPRPKRRKVTNLYTLYDSRSFPSAHSARIAGVLSIVNFYYFDVFLLFISVLLTGAVGYSRVYLKDHFIIDVLAGIVIGVFVSLGVMFLC